MPASVDTTGDDDVSPHLPRQCAQTPTISSTAKNSQPHRRHHEEVCLASDTDSHGHIFMGGSSSRHRVACQSRCGPVGEHDTEAPRAASKEPEDHFTGNVRIVYLFPANAPARATGGQVTFDAGARTAWHAHPVGQTLIVTAGTGRVRFWGGPIQEIKTGDVVWIPPGQKHWHGASPGGPMTHISIQEQLDGTTAEWFEKVTDEQYGVAASVTPPAPNRNSRAQQLFGEIAPKFAELTDNVLYADVPVTFSDFHRHLHTMTRQSIQRRRTSPRLGFVSWQSDTEFGDTADVTSTNSSPQDAGQDVHETRR